MINGLVETIHVDACRLFNRDALVIARHAHEASGVGVAGVKLDFDPALAASDLEAKAVVIEGDRLLRAARHFCHGCDLSPGDVFGMVVRVRHDSSMPMRSRRVNRKKLFFAFFCQLGSLGLQTDPRGCAGGLTGLDE